MYRHNYYSFKLKIPLKYMTPFPTFPHGGRSNQYFIISPLGEIRKGVDLIRKSIIPLHFSSQSYYFFSD
jgi:hypothetical protein